MAKQILRREWGWIGHALRKPASSTTRQALTWNPKAKRKRGRTRNSWRRDTAAELTEQRTNWTGMARAVQNRVRWRGVVDGLCSTGSGGYKLHTRGVDTGDQTPCLQTLVHSSDRLVITLVYLLSKFALLLLSNLPAKQHLPSDRPYLALWMHSFDIYSVN